MSEVSIGGVEACFAAAGPNVEFDPGNFDAGITEEALKLWNHERISMGELPMYYKRRGPGCSVFIPGDLPAGVQPRRKSEREVAGLEAKRMNAAQAARWPKI